VLDTDVVLEFSSAVIEDFLELHIDIDSLLAFSFFFLNTAFK